MRILKYIAALAGIHLAPIATSCAQAAEGESFRWLAGDHHIHSRYSVGWNQDIQPPAPIIGGDAIYPIHMNALMGKYFGLSWIVSTDHGGPFHSKVNLERAYPELLQSRLAVPEVVQFYGMEFDTPGADHSSLIMPFTEHEAQMLYQIESGFSKREPWPGDPGWNTEARMLEALRAMGKFDTAPLLIANHPSRSAPGFRDYGADTPAELRDWNDTAPAIAVGMSGAPGHQASTLNPDGSMDIKAARGGYRNYPTLGGFDQFAATLGGFWDSMIGEGRDWWITANSDSHRHFSEGGSDFWPGEYSKTYVWAQQNHESIMDGIRNGRIFVTTGDLIDELYVTLENPDSRETANIGGELVVSTGDSVTITVRFRDPETPNNNGDYPRVNRLDLIYGEMTGLVSDRTSDINSSTRVLARFDGSNWGTHGTYREVRFTIDDIRQDSYIRVRGTNGVETEPLPDERGEYPWFDLWFYSNPVRISVLD